MFQIKDFKINWDQILNNDPLKCAQSLICQVVAGAEQENEDAIIIKNLVEYVHNICHSSSL